MSEALAERKPRIRLSYEKQGGRVVRARYDAAQTTPENRRHWLMADSLSATAAHRPLVRKRLRERSRYEIQNNPFGRGIVDTYVSEVIGTGPRLQVVTDNRERDEQIERLWRWWSHGTRFVGALQAMMTARITDGEVGGEFVNANRLPLGLKVVPIEADRIARDWTEGMSDPHDGILFDDSGEPLAYHVLYSHPGDLYGGDINLQARRVPAGQFVHLFRSTRPGQTRGIPELTPSLETLAELRRYDKAVLGAAETAASIAAVIQSMAPAAGDDIDELEPMDTFELERRMATTLPRGWSLAQLKPEHPTTNHPLYVRHMYVAAARPLNIPAVVLLGDASNYNYSSGRLDLQSFDRTLEVDRQRIELNLLDRLFYEVVRRAVARGLVDRMPSPGSHYWVWRNRGHVDPLKEAKAEQEALAGHTKTLREVYGSRGLDWRDGLRQRAREQEAMQELGLASAPALPVGREENEDAE